MRQVLTDADNSLIRTAAGASRGLSEDLNLTDLQAIDRLRTLDTKFREHWIGHPWLVLADCYVLPAPMPVDKMLAEIATHGKPVGIVGAGLLSTLRVTVFTMHFCKDKESRAMVERSAKEAEKMAKRVWQMSEEELAAARKDIADRARATKLHKKVQEEND